MRETACVSGQAGRPTAEVADLIHPGDEQSQPPPETAYRRTYWRTAAPARRLVRVGVRGLDFLGELLELVGERGAEPLQLSDLVAVLREAELGGELLLVEDVLLGPVSRLHRLDLEGPVAPQAGRRRDQLADDHVLLQADEAVALAFKRRVGEHLGRLLE